MLNMAWTSALLTLSLALVLFLVGGSHASSGYIPQHFLARALEREHTFGNSSGPRHNTRATQLLEALEFIHNIQNPKNCTWNTSNSQNLVYLKMSFGLAGGFAAQFQFAAAEFMRLLHASNFRVPIVVTGKLIGYSDNDMCNDNNREWTCYFESASNYQDRLLKLGKEISVQTFKVSDEETVPKQFSHLGLQFWWGAVQYYLFRVKPFVLKYIADDAIRPFPFHLPVAGIHVRHGDKHVDGFREHSLAEELTFVHMSTECHYTNSAGDCFVRLNASQHHIALQILYRALHGEAHLMRLSDIESLNSSLGLLHDINRHLFLDQKFVQNAVNQLQLHRGNQNQIWQFNETVVFPLQIFVASDDPNVVKSAQRLGYLTDNEGVSQHTSTTGMLSTLTNHPEIAFNASLEIITDIFYLSHCSTLIGIGASQVFRMAVAMSNATGTLHHAAAMDLDQLGRVHQLSRKYKVPFPEIF